MNRTTSLMVVAALLSAGGAYAMRPQPVPEADFEDTGEPLFEGFTDPTLATALEVVAWDDAEAKVLRFAVEQKDGRWVIPSHNDYPADGTERMGKAAASFIDVQKDIYYGDNPADHAEFGVLDPSQSEGEGDEKGQRITIKDASGGTLVDVIVGKSIPDKEGMYYVRYPDQNRVYGAKLELDISTTFGDWIEKDLLHIERDDVVQVRYTPYTVDETQGRVVGVTDSVIATKQKPEGGGADTWVAAPEMNLPAGKELDSMKVRQMVTSMDNLKIVGVRPQPAQLTLPSLQSKGFFVTQDGKLMGNEGEISAVTDDGLVFTLYFGEVTFESGIALTAGSPSESGDANEGEEDAPKGEEKADEPEEPAAKDEKKEGEASRYMFVQVRYEPSLDKTLGSAEPEADAAKPEDGTEGQEADAAEKAESAEADTEGSDEASMREGAERAKKLRERFDKWFYVISEQSFEQIHKPREELIKDAKKDED